MWIFRVFILQQQAGVCPNAPCSHPSDTESHLYSAPGAIEWRYMEGRHTSFDLPSRLLSLPNMLTGSHRYTAPWCVNPATHNRRAASSTLRFVLTLASSLETMLGRYLLNNTTLCANWSLPWGVLRS